MTFTAQKRSRDKVRAGALRRCAENSSVKQSQWRQGKRHSRQGTGVRRFWNANERSAKANNISQDGREKGQSQSGHRCLGHAGNKRFAASAPNRSRQPQERNRGQHCDSMSVYNRDLGKQVGHGKAAAEHRQKPDGYQETSKEGESAEHRGR